MSKDQEMQEMEAAETLIRHDPIVLTDREFLLFEDLMTRAVEPNVLVRTEAADFNKGRFDVQGRYHWS